MLSKAKIKLINSLKLGKYRRQHKLFVAEGTTNILDFLQSGSEAIDLFATANWLEQNTKYLKKYSVTVVNNKDLSKISFLKNPSEVIGIFKSPEENKLNLNSIDDIVLMLDDIRDPGNLGTIIRTADWFGISTIICSKESADAFNPKVVQASMGSLARVSVYYEDLQAILESKPEALKVFGAVMNGEAIEEISKPKKGLILIGNEAHGISDKLMPFIDKKITISSTPGNPGSSPESLNASIAAAIICYAFRK